VPIQPQPHALEFPGGFGDADSTTLWANGDCVEMRAGLDIRELAGAVDEQPLIEARTDRRLRARKEPREHAAAGGRGLGRCIEMADALDLPYLWKGSNEAGKDPHYS
jgi:hypothetical protein